MSRSYRDIRQILSKQFSLTLISIFVSDSEKNLFQLGNIHEVPSARGTMPSSSWSEKICLDPEKSVAFKETANERIFLMKDLAAVEEAVGLGAKIYEGDISF